MKTATLYLTPDGWTASATINTITFSSCKHTTQDKAVSALERLTQECFDEWRVVPAPVVPGESVLDQGARQGRLL